MRSTGRLYPTHGSILSNNGLSVTIPNLGSLTGLIWLELNDNQLTGTISDLGTRLVLNFALLHLHHLHLTDYIIYRTFYSLIYS